MKPKMTPPYLQLSPSSELNQMIDSYWRFQNPSDKPTTQTIFPDSYFKLIIIHVGGKIVAFFQTGLWPSENQFVIPGNACVYGIRFKILAAEHVFQREVASLLQTHTELDLDFWGVRNFRLDDLQTVVNQYEQVILKKLTENGEIEGRKLQLSQLLYKMKGEISAEEVSDQIAWSNRQINRYMNKYLGISLKTYLNIQKAYNAYIQIREGRFFPDDGFYDQPHFIRHIKKYTGHTPRELFQQQHDRFIQLSHIRKK